MNTTFPATASENTDATFIQFMDIIISAQGDEMLVKADQMISNMTKEEKRGFWMEMLCHRLQYPVLWIVDDQFRVNVVYKGVVDGVLSIEDIQEMEGGKAAVAYKKYARKSVLWELEQIRRCLH